MSADRLRQAATLLRERAEAATPGPWSDEDGDVWSQDRDGQVHVVARRSESAAYIATMSPPVALALADWLDASAEIWFGSTQSWDELREAFPVLRVADAILWATA